MKIHVEQWDEKNDGALSEHALRKKIESKGYRVSRYVYSPGTMFPPHTHEVDKIDAVVSGKFCIRMHNQEILLVAGDCLYVPNGTVHSAEVIGNEPVVSLDAVKL
jgi:quercetin dioxygenase-like cupin family protein